MCVWWAGLASRRTHGTTVGALSKSRNSFLVTAVLRKNVLSTSSFSSRRPWASCLCCCSDFIAMLSFRDTHQPHARSYCPATVCSLQQIYVCVCTMTNFGLNHSTLPTTRANASAAVKPGLSMPYKLTSPCTPCTEADCTTKSPAGSPGPTSFGRTPA